MRTVVVVFLCLMLTLSASAFAKTGGSSDKFMYLDLSGEPPGAFSGLTDGHLPTCGPSLDTTYYGGTVWDSGDGRWEAIVDSCWTFDSGVGTVVIGSGETGADYPGVNPYKFSSLHAYMEGWIGWDNSYSEIPYFRVLDDGVNGTVWDNVCVGADATVPGILGEDWSYYCGVLTDEAEALCYGDQQNKEGYGDFWTVCIGKTYYNISANSTATLWFSFVNETEPGFDFTTVEVDTSGDGSGITTVTTYDGLLFGKGVGEPLFAGETFPSAAADSIQIRFCFNSDGSWSDEDGLHPTVCGAFAVDDILVEVNGVQHAPATFEGGDDGGWKLLPPEEGKGGEWSNLVDVSNFPNNTPCECSLQGNVLVFENLASLNEGLKDNLAGSPWIELQSDRDGPGKFIQADIYAEMPAINYRFAQFMVKWFPDPCPVTGLDRESPWTSNGFVYYFGSVPQCTNAGYDGARINFGTTIPPSATEVRIAVGVVSYCRFFSDCSGISGFTPLFDNICLGVFGDPGSPGYPVVPPIGSRQIDLPQDSFPANGTLLRDAPGRFDAGVVTNDSQPEIGTNLGDTLVVHGATDSAEVYVEFRVIPGPGIDATALAAFYGRVESRGGGWYSARMDTAEVGQSGAFDGTWMTAYHESDPNRQSTGDTDPDPNDPGGSGHLANDIFPDNLFTPGTRIDLFYRARLLRGGAWCMYPDTVGGTYLEWECLPSSMKADSTWNCVLYVDHFDGGGAQPFIEGALLSILGAGAEGKNWDRYDVRASSSQQATFGRPLNSEYGATLVQALGYIGILWNSGSLDAYNLVKEDADILNPWLTHLDFGPNNLYLSGDGIAHSMTNEAASDPSAFELLSEIIGAVEYCNTLRDYWCAPTQLLCAWPCIPVLPVGSPPPVSTTTRTYDHFGQGNGCPQLRSFDVLEVGTPGHGATATGDEEYDRCGTPVQWASIATYATEFGHEYRAVLDGLSVHIRRDENLGPCDFYTGNAGPVEERIREVLTYLGLASPLVCDDFTYGIGVPNDPVRNPFRTALANFAPNPLLAGAKGKITFTMAKEGKARVDIFDVNGRLVSTVFDEIAQEGVNEAFWNGTDGAGRDVASGVYFYRLDTSADIFSKKMVVVRNPGK